MWMYELLQGGNILAYLGVECMGLLHWINFEPKWLQGQQNFCCENAKRPSNSVAELVC